MLRSVIGRHMPVRPWIAYGSFQANLLGSTLGLYIAYHLERYYRHRREVSLRSSHSFGHSARLRCCASRYTACIAHWTPSPSRQMTKKTTTPAEPSSFLSTTPPRLHLPNQQPRTALLSQKQRGCRMYGTSGRSCLISGRRAKRRTRGQQTAEQDRRHRHHQRSWSLTSETVQKLMVELVVAQSGRT